jgi:hypothetical protein
MANDEAQVIGGECGGVKRSITFRLDNAFFGFNCNYVSASGGKESNTIKGTYTTDTSPEHSDLIVHIKAQEFIKDAESSAFCPKKNFLFLTATLETQEFPAKRSTPPEKTDTSPVSASLIRERKWFKCTRSLVITVCMTFAALVVLPATASAINTPVLTQPTGTALEKGALIKITNVGEVLLREGPNQSVIYQCPVAQFTGTLIINLSNTVEANITSSTFTGDGAGNACTPGFEWTNSLPWCLRSDELMKDDEFQLVGGECGGAWRPVTFSLGFGGVNCNYVSASGGKETNVVRGT